MEVPPEVHKIAYLIKSMKVRGAGRIARTAAYAMKLAAQKYSGSDLEGFKAYMAAVADVIGSTRPTAVSLHNALRFVLNRVKSAKSLEEAINAAVAAADAFITTSLYAVKRIGEIGARLIEDGDTVLTHCNSSAALSILKTAHRIGKRIRVYATETRPKFQGLLSYRELSENGIPVTLIPDSAVRFVLREVDKVVVGADTVAANGAVINKVGTSLIALAAHEARVRFYVAAETYKFSPATVLGELVTIEERGPEEVVPVSLLARHPNLRVRNPAFDVTPPDYIDLIVTERGVIPPKAAALILLEDYGATLSEDLSTLPIDMEDAA